jgi:hypothetical protein
MGVNCQGALVASLLGRIAEKACYKKVSWVSISDYDLSSWKNRTLVLDEIAGLKAKANAVVMTNDGTKGDAILRMLKVDENKILFWKNGMDTDHLELPDNWDPNNFKKELEPEPYQPVQTVAKNMPVEEQKSLPLQIKKRETGDEAGGGRQVFLSTIHPMHGMRSKSFRRLTVI